MPFIIEIPELSGIESKLAAAPTAIRTTLEGAIRDATLIMATLAKSQAPVRTGKMRSAITSEVAGLQGAIYPNLVLTPYAMYVHEGTGIYGKNRRPIVPVNKKVLASKGNPGWGSANKAGYFIIGKRSLGQRPNPFMKRAYDLGKVKVMALMKVSVDELIKEL